MLLISFRWTSRTKDLFTVMTSIRSFFDRNNHDNYAVLKLDLQYLGRPGVMQLSETDYVCHGLFVNQRPFSLFTSGVYKAVIEKVCSQVNLAKNDIKKNHYSKSFLVYSLMMTDAQAQATCKDNSSTKNISSIKNISSRFSSEELMQKLGTCAIDARRGAGSVFTGMFDGAIKLFTTPPKELWNGLKKSVVEIKKFVIHLKDEMIKLKNAFSQLDLDMILQIGCPLAGEIIASAGITALTGAGIAMLSARIVQTISRMSKLKHLFDKLNKLAALGKSKFAGKVLACGLK